jgi:hypothetical protein
MFFDRDDIRRRKLAAKLPGAFKRWPLLAGVAAGLWVMVLAYLIRMILSLISGEVTTALFSLLWSVVCFFLWSLLYRWARRHQAD